MYGIWSNLLLIVNSHVNMATVKCIAYHLNLCHTPVIANGSLKYLEISLKINQQLKLLSGNLHGCNNVIPYGYQQSVFLSYRTIQFQNSFSFALEFCNGIPPKLRGSKAKCAQFRIRIPHSYRISFGCLRLCTLPSHCF